MTQPVKPVADRFAFKMPTRFAFEMPTRFAFEMPGAGTQLMIDWFMYELPPWIRTPPVLDRLGDDLSDMPNSRYDKLPPRAEVNDSIRSPKADLMHLQLEVAALKFVQSGPSTLAMKTLPIQSTPVAFTCTKVPNFSGVTSWDQYRQVLSGRMGGTTLRSPYNSCITWRGTH